jgi:hypothetical protein
VGVDIPQPFNTKVSGSLGSIGPVSVSGIPSSYTINVASLPKIQLGVDVHAFYLGLGVDPLTVAARLDPLDVSLSLERIPDIRGHLPADFSVGVSLLGVELLSVRLCGEAQVITEPYRPNPCEHCGARAREPNAPRSRRALASPDTG